MNTIFRFMRIGGNNFKERLIVKSFKTSAAMYSFAQSSAQANLWEYASGPNARHDKFAALKPGTYVFAGGEWRNVKSIDPSALAHM